MSLLLWLTHGFISRTKAGVCAELTLSLWCGQCQLCLFVSGLCTQEHLSCQHLYKGGWWYMFFLCFGNKTPEWDMYSKQMKTSYKHRAGSNLTCKSCFRFFSSLPFHPTSNPHSYSLSCETCLPVNCCLDSPPVVRGPLIDPTPINCSHTLVRVTSCENKTIPRIPMSITHFIILFLITYI